MMPFCVLAAVLCLLAAGCASNGPKAVEATASTSSSTTSPTPETGECERLYRDRSLYPFSVEGVMEEWSAVQASIRAALDTDPRALYLLGPLEEYADAAEALGPLTDEWAVRVKAAELDGIVDENEIRYMALARADLLRHLALLMELEIDLTGHLGLDPLADAELRVSELRSTAFGIDRACW